MSAVQTQAMHWTTGWLNSYCSAPAIDDFSNFDFPSRIFSVDIGINVDVDSSIRKPQTIEPTPAATSSPSSGTNVGAIAGGVVGGVAGVAIIAGSMRYFFLRQFRTSQNNGSATPLCGLQTSHQDGRKWDGYHHEIGNNSNEHQAAELPAHPSP
ncbi:hypothetical protein IFM61606_07568 [Aspergillus udagawae]|nr:hypothetical protein IFM61606_07568 [Aspergillus udagawae]